MKKSVKRVYLFIFYVRGKHKRKAIDNMKDSIIDLLIIINCVTESIIEIKNRKSEKLMINYKNS